MQVQETMIDGFERQGEAELAIDLSFDLSEPGHGTDGHNKKFTIFDF
jgi:hypothetical protein